MCVKRSNREELRYVVCVLLSNQWVKRGEKKERNDDDGDGDDDDAKRFG